MLQRTRDTVQTTRRETSAVSRGGGEFVLGELFLILAESWKLILAAILLTTAAALAYIQLAKPIYRAEALLQVEHQAQGIGALADLSNFFKEESAIVSEFQIIRSRMVLGEVVKQLGLDIHVEPKGLFGSGPIQVDEFNVPESQQGKPFTLVASRYERYKLLGPENETVLQGGVGELSQAPFADGKVELFVSRLEAEPGDEYLLTKRRLLDTVNQLRRELRVDEMGKDSGIIRLSVEGPDSGEITRLVNAIANVYVRQNVERKSAEAEKTLAFLEVQLPILREQMESAEAALNSYRLQQGTINLPLETQSLLKQAVDLEAKISELATNREELLLRFQPKHPRIAALDAQINALKRQLVAIDKRAQSLPNTQQELLRLSRDAQVSTTLYTALLNKAQELKVVKAGTVGNVRIIDSALQPHIPVKPVKGVILLLGVILGALAGVVIAVVRKRLHGGVEDPELVEQLGLPVYATVPNSHRQRELERKAHAGSGKVAVLAAHMPEDLSVESLRSLRTSLHFAQLDAKNAIIMVTGPSPGAGKSFVSANLAVVLARSGKQVLLIDGDLRKGRLHAMFGIERKRGLSEIIAGESSLEEVVHSTGIDNLDLVPTGTLPPNPSELLLHENFALALEQIMPFYDHILIDSPPVLAVSDACIIGSHAGATLLVLRDGQHPLREIEQSIKTLRQAGVNLRGAVFNRMGRLNSRFGYGRYYGYSYNYGR